MLDLLATGAHSRMQLRGLNGSSAPVLLSTLAHQHPALYLAVMPDKEEAAFFANDLVNITDEDQVYFLPSSFKRGLQFGIEEPSSTIQRTETLKRIAGYKPGSWALVVTYPEALMEKVSSKTELAKNTLQLKVGEKISIEFIKDVLTEYRFERVDFVFEPGQFSIRGSIVDVFSFSSESPCRIDFFGDEVESIRSFDIETQLSNDKMSMIQIIPNLQGKSGGSQKIDLTDFLPDTCILWLHHFGVVADQLIDLYKKAGYRDTETDTLLPDKDFIISQPAALRKGVLNFSMIETGHVLLKDSKSFEFRTSPQPALAKNFELLSETWNQQHSAGITNYLLSDNPKQIERIGHIFRDMHLTPTYQSVETLLHEGFTDADLKLSLFTDHQLFERYHKFKLKQHFTKSETLTLSDLFDLHPGDYVVHIDHGIGKFGGLVKVEHNGKRQEVVRLVYQDNDILYVSIHALHKISKYKGKDSGEPKIYKLGTGAWQKLKATTKSKVKDIARELIALYAKRKASPGFQFSPDSFMQEKLESSFIYEDTPDQEKATRMVKASMENEHPMDMLVCGDVGFGKTEIAIRAAFKAVADNKQVAVLVPTTILALQHYKTFSERLKEFPCTVDYISRFKKGISQKKTLEDLASGKIDIIIGTHRLIGSDIKFKDLGLLIIDEEQKFGVKVKEKLKELKLNVDTLTLTATPIPRTLQFSLMGARDLSIINTPPPNRHPIVTEVHTLNEDILREAIEYEISRGGQVFFIHNRIQNITEVEALIKKLCPKINTVIAHGQMDGPQLEQIMLDFINGNFDVLIATAIIESGLDIPNANTIIINNAQNFGLSDLHQLRGRVGRSNKKAFCYLIAPPLSTLTPEARRRLKAIEDFSELGSGFNISMQDLDIRGAGNLLGGEQSGFISDIGYETYQRILNEALLELRETEFKDVYADENPNQTPLEDKAYVTDIQIDTDMEVLIPDNYVGNITERMKLYRELDNVESEDKLLAFENNLIDRFGPIPAQVTALTQVVRLRWRAAQLGIEKMILKNDKMLCHFIGDQQSDFYRTDRFMQIIQKVQQHHKIFKIKEAKDKLSLTCEPVKTIQVAMDRLKLLAGE